ncbi:hypothetical protein Tco_0324317 [Tanacetum coccineum]
MAETMEDTFQFIKELHDNAFSGSDHEDANGHIEKVLEIVYLFHIPNITEDQIMLQAFPMSLAGSASRWLRNKPTGSIKFWEDLKTNFLNNMEKIQRTIDEMPSTLLNGDARAKRHEENSNLIKEIRDSIDVAIRNQKALIKALEIQIGRLYDDCCDEKKGSCGLKDLDAYSIRTTHRNDSLPKKEKDPGSFTLPCYINNVCFAKSLDDLGASVNMAVKHPKGIAENVLVGIGKFVFPVDFIILDMPEDVNDGKIVDEPMMEVVKTRCYFISGLDDYPKDCDIDRRIHIDCAYNLRLSCMIGFEYVHANFLLILPINVMSKKFYNSIMKDKIEFKGRNDLGNFVNVHIFVGNFYVITDFTVVEDMDPYLDEGIGDVIVGEPFFKASCVEGIMFDGIITISDGDDGVTYQLVWSNPRFKHITNEKCNKIPSLPKVNEQDKMNGISHSYQKVKGFYKGFLNIGPEYIQDAKVSPYGVSNFLDMTYWFPVQDLAGKKSTTLVEYLLSGILCVL